MIAFSKKATFEHKSEKTFMLAWAVEPMSYPIPARLLEISEVFVAAQPS